MGGMVPGLQAQLPMYHDGPQAAETTAQPQGMETFDDSAFEAAFAQAHAEIAMETDKHEQPVAQEEILEPSQHEAIRIGSDRIESAEGEGVDSADELAKTAGQLLDYVRHDQSQKFKESNFLALMRQLRDREVIIDGDKIRQVSTLP
jgi:hypothetical protein